jgi:hypothetical protein
MAAEMSDRRRPSSICSRPLVKDRSATAMSLSASGLVRPTGAVRAESLKKPSKRTPKSRLTMSPSWRMRPEGMPWMISSLTETQTEAG